MNKTELKKAGLKQTGPRIKILNLFEQNPAQHLSAEDIYQALFNAGEEVSLATVYRVLTQFEDAGILNKHSFANGIAVYELDQGEHHDHIVCVHCAKVSEFVDEVIEERQQAVAKEAKFTITDHRLVIYGLCEACGRRRKTA